MSASDGLKVLLALDAVAIALAGLVWWLTRPSEGAPVDDDPLGDEFDWSRP